MARPTRPAAPALTASAQQVSGNPANVPASLAASAAVYRPRRKMNPQTDRYSIAKQWQVDVYRHLNICGEARYAATLFAAMAARAEIGVSEPQALSRKAVWVASGPEVEAFAELCPTVRERRKLITDYMTHFISAGECYLIARDRVDTDPPGLGTIWEIVAVTEIRRTGETWSVRHENGNYLDLTKDDPVIRLWNPDPENRLEAWSPFRSMLPTLVEIEWLTKHIFTQVRSRLMSAGVWFLPDNLTFPPPPPDAVDGGAEAIAQMNEAEQFMLSLAASSMSMMEADDVSFPSIVLADPLALAAVDQKKLIQFWSEIDDKAMILRDGAIRRFGLGMDLPTDMAVDVNALGTGSTTAGSSTNHWGEWAKQEQAISSHVEPALDIFTGSLTAAYLRSAVENTDKVIAYDTASLRLRPDRSKEAMEWYDRGVLKADVALRETGFDPDSDRMTTDEHRIWLLNKLVSGSPSPEQMQAAFFLLTGKDLPVPALAPADSGASKGVAGPNQPPTLEDHPYEGPPRVQHDQSPAPFSAEVAASEVLILRALEKAGNRLLNDGKRGRDRDRTTPPHLAHIAGPPQITATGADFDFTLSSTVFGDLPLAAREEKERQMRELCAELYNTGTPYTRAALIERMKGR